MPQILVNGQISMNVSRISDNIFQLKVDKKMENVVSVRILSTVEKYNSELSEKVKCLWKQNNLMLFTEIERRISKFQTLIISKWHL